MIAKPCSVFLVVFFSADNHDGNTYDKPDRLKEG